MGEKKKINVTSSKSIIDKMAIEKGKKIFKKFSKMTLAIEKTNS